MLVMIKPVPPCCSVGLCAAEPWEVIGGNCVMIDDDVIQIFKIRQGDKVRFMAEDELTFIDLTSAGYQPMWGPGPENPPPNKK